MDEKKQPSLYRADDEERGHIPVITSRMLALRAAQLVFAVSYAVLNAFAAVGLDFGSMPTFLIPFAASLLLVFYVAWLGYSIVRRPKLYHWVAHLTLEALTNLTWLASWAMLAVLATGLNRMQNGTPAAGEDQTTVISTQALQVSEDAMTAARIIVAAASGVGMLAWGLLTASLISTLASIVEVRKYQKQAKAEKSEPVQEILPESSFDFD